MQISTIKILLVVAVVIAIIAAIVLPISNSQNHSQSTNLLSAQPLSQKTQSAQSLVDKNLTEYQDGDGATIIKNVLPKTLQDVKNVLTQMDSDLAIDLDTLQHETKKLDLEFADLEEVRANLQEIIISADKQGANTEKLLTQFDKELYAPLTSRESIALKEELTLIDKELIDAEKTLFKYQIFDQQ